MDQSDRQKVQDIVLVECSHLQNDEEWVSFITDEIFDNLEEITTPLALQNQIGMSKTTEMF